MQNWTELSCQVEGRAVTTDPGPEHRWKRRVQQAVRELWTGGTLHEPVRAEIRFGFPARDFHRVALANLLKPTIDGVSSVVFEHERSSNEWDYEDWRIFRLTATKHLSTSPAVHIRLYPLNRLERPRSDGAFVAGIPRPGETTGEKAWKAAIEQRIGTLSARGLGPGFALDLRFVLPAREMEKDIDNLARVAAAAVGGSYGQKGTSISRIDASKEPDSSTQQSGLFLRAWMP